VYWHSTTKIKSDFFSLFILYCARLIVPLCPNQETDEKVLLHIIFIGVVVRLWGQWGSCGVA
jgi:hypothetical protein